MLAVKGITAIAHMQTASQLMPCVLMSKQAVVAIMPPTVRLALHRFRSPFVLKASVKSAPASALVITPANCFIFLNVKIYMHKPVANTYAVKANVQQCSNNQKTFARRAAGNVGS